MSDIKELTGLDFEVGENELIYNKENFEPAIDWAKSFEDGSYAYVDQECELENLYFGSRYMELTRDQEILKKYQFMADATVINVGNVGKEYVKTVGHYHGYVPGTKIAYPEIYEAVSGKIEYLLQSEEDENGKVEVIWVVTTPGDKVLMLPNYGHVSMNVGDEPAIEIDMQIRDNPNNSDYSKFKEKVGGAFYRTEDGLTKNPHYKVKSLRIVKPKEVPEWGLTKDTPLYVAVTQNPEKFEYLTKPQNFEFDFDKFFEDIEL